MYGTDTNAGLNLSAGAAGMSALGATQSIVLAVVVLFAVVAVVTAVRAIVHRRAKSRRAAAPVVISEAGR